ncbi:auxin-responsive protein [Artemisia annua]|uniref:Auxin-responsive protein n=1 Tax=Artemisia annua TaxID=35608 RepID=A0A2U1LQ35_ARTAN|nr:auxin-responsive protein [Artemisia annua]
MEGGYSRKLLDLIPNERNWLVKKEDDHGDGDEKKLELRLGPPGVEEDWSAKNKPKPANTSQKSMFVSAVKRLRVIKSSEISSICMGSKQEKIQRC